MQKVTKATLKKMNTLELVEMVVDLTNDFGKITTEGEAKPYINEIANRLGLEPMQVLFLCVFVDQCDDGRIQYRDIARHFDCRTVAVMAKSDILDQLVHLGVIARRKDSDGDISYRIPQESLEAIKIGRLPEREKLDNLSIKEWIDMLDDLTRRRYREEISDEDLNATLQELIEKNQHLEVARKLKGFAFNYTDLLLFLVMTMLFVNNHDDRIRQSDIDSYFNRSALRRHTQALESGTHTLMNTKLIENSCVDGQVENDSWCLTNYAKYEVYAELNLKQPINVRANLTHFEDIQEKKMFYTPNVKKQVDQLSSLLENNKMQRVLKRLGDKGMRKGFTCIFYGGPGTGKTETVLQLARLTKRDIMLVDVPSIRSKWVGETEKNIQSLFERYRKAVSNSTEGNMPILLFNEADALLNKRNEGGTKSVDKMENAMQNIILQEMENLEGIMIATTNLTGNLDDAFERRFLYKIEFEKPTPKERKHIWMSMLPDLKEDDALKLAEHFDFSGGQIENIARKRIISDILDDRDTLDIDSVIESCKNESLNTKTSRKHVGF